MSLVTLDGANVTLALESVLAMLPPFVGDTTVGGGERPLAVFAFGSGVVSVWFVGVVPGPVDVGAVVVVPTSTVIVPVPVPAPVAGVVVPSEAGAGVVVALAFELEPVEEPPVSGVVIPVAPFDGTVVFCVLVPVEEAVVVVVPMVVDGTVRFASVGVSWLLETGGAAEVSVEVAGTTDVDVVVVPESLEVVLCVVEVVVAFWDELVAVDADAAAFS